MSGPAGRSEWAWTWRGFGCPSKPYNDLDLPKEIEHCGVSFYGIGDFTCWRRKECSELSVDQKQQLLTYLITSRLTSEYPTINILRPYIGDVECRDDRDEFSRDGWWGFISVAECEAQAFPHGGTFSDGPTRRCGDCGSVFAPDSEWNYRLETIQQIASDCFNTRAANHNRNESIRSIAESYYDKLQAARFTMPIDQLKLLAAGAALFCREYPWRTKK